MFYGERTRRRRKNNHTAQVKNEDKGQTSLGNRQVEEKQATKDQITKDQSQKDKEVDVVISNIYPRVVQAIVDTIPATDTLQSPSTLDNIRIAGIIDDSIFSDTMRIRWHEYDKPLITEETVLPKKGTIGSCFAAGFFGVCFSAKRLQNALLAIREVVCQTLTGLMVLWLPTSSPLGTSTIVICRSKSTKACRRRRKHSWK